MKKSFVAIKNGLPQYTAHMAFGDFIESGYVDENGCTYMEIPEGVSDEQILNEYLVGASSKELIRLPNRPSPFHRRDVVAQDWVYDIADAKLERSKVIALACGVAIKTGFNSYALGFKSFYPCNDKDQANMVASVTDSLNPANDDDWVTPFWCADANGNWTYRLHTKAQIQKAGADGKAHIVAQLTKNAQLQAQIQAATTEEELNLIVW